jgi:DNA repair exonuclease SbcCD ATPase subunit
VHEPLDLLEANNIAVNAICPQPHGIELHVGSELEILVQDRNSPKSPASELGGGYSNLIGIAFRIALQKVILPEVYVIVLDEPNTHVDAANMELLIPFFDRLKENVSSYGIDKLILIDHHPDWKESNVGLISIGAETQSSQTGLEIAAN